MTPMRTTGTKRAMRNAFLRLRLHTTAKGVVRALLRQGVRVDEELVRQVRFEMLKETAGARVVAVPKLIPSSAVRRSPKALTRRR